MGRIQKETENEAKLEDFNTVDEGSDVNLELPQELGDNNYQYHECKEALIQFIDAYQAHLECKDKLELKKARLLIHTDWENALPFHKRPTVADKEAYIAEKTAEDKMNSRKFYLDKLFKEELYKLELMRYEKK